MWSKGVHGDRSGFTSGQTALRSVTGASTWEGNPVSLETDITRGLAALRAAVASALLPPGGPALAVAGSGAGAPGGTSGTSAPSPLGWLLSEAADTGYESGTSTGSGYGDA